jgi:TPR repeat protein
MKQAEPNLGDLAFHAASGNAEAQYSLGVRFLLGESVEQDLEAAYQWLTRAAVADYQDAQALAEELARHRVVIHGENKLGSPAASVRIFAGSVYAVAAELGRDASLALRRWLSSVRNVSVEKVVTKADSQLRAKVWQFPTRRGVARSPDSP